jgi:hypothetical protein
MVSKKFNFLMDNFKEAKQEISETDRYNTTNNILISSRLTWKNNSKWNYISNLWYDYNIIT